MFVCNQRCKILTENFGTLFFLVFALYSLKSLVNEGTSLWTDPTPSA